MKTKHIAAVLLAIAYALLFPGCAYKPINTPSTEAISGDIQQVQSVVGKIKTGTDIVDYKHSRALEYF